MRRFLNSVKSTSRILSNIFRQNESGDNGSDSDEEEDKNDNDS